MSSQLANASILEQDLTYSVSSGATGIFGVIGITERGEMHNPKRVISSWPEYQKYYGGLLVSNPFPLLCKRALDGGAKLRVCSVRNFTDINVAGNTTAATATAQTCKVATFTSTNLKAGDTTVVTLNGTSLAAVPFSVNHNQTMLNIAAAITAGFPAVVEKAVVVTTTGNYRVILISPKSGVTISTNTIVVTGTNPVPTVSFATLTGIVNSLSATLLTLTPKGPGAAYNKMVITLLPSQSGQAGYFNLTIALNDGTISESYNNLKVLAVATKGEQTGLAQLANSALVDWATPDLSAATDLAPLYTILTWVSGANGSAPTQVDYIGASSSNTGLYSFRSYGDLTALAFPGKDISNVAMHQAGAQFAKGWGEIAFLHDIPYTATTPDTIITLIDALGIDSSYSGYYGGGNSVPHPVTGIPTDIDSVADVMGLISKTHSNHGANYSFAGKRRGLIPNSFGPVYDFGSIGLRGQFEQIAARGANMIIFKDKRTTLWNNFTAQAATSVLSYMNVRMFINALKRDLRSTLENYIEEPNIPDTWKSLYLEVKPYMDSWVEKKALFGAEGKGWAWEGDQFAKSDLSNLTVNNPSDVQLGKYLVKLFVKPAPGINQITLVIALSPASISFEELL